MNIVHAISRLCLADGGVVRAVIDLTSLLAARGHAVTLLCREAPDVPASWGSPGTPRLATLRSARRPMGLYSSQAIGEAARIIGGADIVHLHTPWDTANVQLASAARRAKRPYILTIHGMLDDWCMSQKSAKKRLYLALAGRKLLERAARIHCTAEAELAQSRVWYPRGRGTVIPIAFDLREYRSLPGPEEAFARFPAVRDAKARILFLSRLHIKKGVHVAIDAAAILRDRGRDFALFLAGTGDEPYTASLKAQVERLKLGGHVHLLGLVTGSLKLSLYQACEVFILPTSQENFGLVLPEAMACRTPVITTKGVDIWPELLACGGAEIVEPTPEAFAAALAGLLDDSARRRAMGERGRAWVFEHLDSAKVVERFEAVYRECIAEMPRG